MKSNSLLTVWYALRPSQHSLDHQTVGRSYCRLIVPTYYIADCRILYIKLAGQGCLLNSINTNNLELHLSWIFFYVALALNLSSKNQQMTTFSVQNNEAFTKTTSFFSQSSFWMKEVVIWWLERERSKAREKKIPKICA